MGDEKENKILHVVIEEENGSDTYRTDTIFIHVANKTAEYLVNSLLSDATKNTLGFKVVTDKEPRELLDELESEGVNLEWVELVNEPDINAQRDNNHVRYFIRKTGAPNSMVFNELLDVLARKTKEIFLSNIKVPEPKKR